MNAHYIFIERYPYILVLKILILIAFLLVSMVGCSNIWNASDLAVWVKDRAVEQGCQRETIELEEWYTKTDDGNVWRGTCREAQGNTKSFGINVDTVWRPSQEKSEPVGPVIKPEKTEKLPK